MGPTSVLTAAHVIEGAVAVRVRFDADLPGEWTAEAIPCWADPRSNLAVLTIAPREGEVAVARFSRIGGDRAAVLAAQAVGSPRFKLKTDDDAAQLQYRDSHQTDGSVAVLSNRREGTLEVTVPPPERDSDLQVSPWEGMSGAAGLSCRPSQPTVECACCGELQEVSPRPSRTTVALGLRACRGCF